MFYCFINDSKLGNVRHEKRGLEHGRYPSQEHLHKDNYKNHPIKQFFDIYH